MGSSAPREGGSSAGLPSGTCSLGSTESLERLWEGGGETPSGQGEFRLVGGGGHQRKAPPGAGGGGGGRMSSVDSASIIHGHAPHTHTPPLPPPRPPSGPSLGKGLQHLGGSSSGGTYLSNGRAGTPGALSGGSAPGYRASEQQHFRLGGAAANGPLQHVQSGGKGSGNGLSGGPHVLRPPPPPPRRQDGLSSTAPGGRPPAPPAAGRILPASVSVSPQQLPPQLPPPSQPSRKSLDEPPWLEGSPFPAAVSSRGASQGPSVVISAESSAGMTTTSHSPAAAGYSFTHYPFTQFDPLGLRGLPADDEDGSPVTDAQALEPSCLLPALLSSLMEELGPEDSPAAAAAAAAGRGYIAAVHPALQLGPPTSASPPPQHFVCPITRRVMADPVVAADGFLYEREAILDWMQQQSQQQQQQEGQGRGIQSSLPARRHHQSKPGVPGNPGSSSASVDEHAAVVLTSPVTGRPLQDGRLVPVIPLRAAIMEWRWKGGGDP